MYNTVSINFAWISNGISLLWSLEWTDPSSRVLQNVVCVISKCQRWGSLGPSRTELPHTHTHTHTNLPYANSSDNEVKTVKAVTLFHIIPSHDSIITANAHTSGRNNNSQVWVNLGYSGKNYEENKYLLPWAQNTYRCVWMFPSLFILVCTGNRKPMYFGSNKNKSVPTWAVLGVC